MHVTVEHAQTHLSDLIAAAERGEEVVISRGTTPVVILKAVPAPPVRKQRVPGSKQRVPGSMKGEFTVGPEFFDPLPNEELAAWEGG